MPTSLSRRPGTAYFTTAPTREERGRHAEHGPGGAGAEIHGPDHDGAEHEQRAREDRHDHADDADRDGQCDQYLDFPLMAGLSHRPRTRNAEAPVSDRGLGSCRGWGVRPRLGRPWPGVAELAGLVVDVLGDLAQLLAVLTGVVGAEQQLAAALELYAEVGLGAASVAPVDRRERCCGGGCRSGHVGPHSRSGDSFNDQQGDGSPARFAFISHNSQPRWILPARDAAAIR